MITSCWNEQHLIIYWADKNVDNSVRLMVKKLWWNISSICSYWSVGLTSSERERGPLYPHPFVYALLWSIYTSGLYDSLFLHYVRPPSDCSGQHCHGKVRSFYAWLWLQHFCVHVWDFSGYSRFFTESKNMHIRLIGDFKSFPCVSEWVLKGWWWTANPCRVKRSDRTTAQSCFPTKLNIGTVRCGCPGSASAATSGSSS